MITVEKFLQCVQENAARITHYEKGGDGSGGGCDCIGLIIGALRLAGVRWDGTHGSNWAARNALQEPWPYRISTERELCPGMVVFKAYEPGEKNYNLPDAYKGGDDPLDYYHVGVVTGTNPLRITHCTSGGADGIKVDTALGNWEFYGRQKQVNYTGKEDAMEIKCHAMVEAANGYPVKLRAYPSTDGAILAQVPVNTVVGVLAETNEKWWLIEYVNHTGYMMREFLTPLGKPAEPDAPQIPDAPVIPAPDAGAGNQEQLELLRGYLAQGIKIIDKLLEGVDVG